LSEGEKLCVVKRKGLQSEWDCLKKENFVKLEPAETEVEVFKCKVCRQVFRKEKKTQGESGPKGKKSEARYKLSVFYSHIISMHPERVREMSVEKLPVNYAPVFCLLF